MLDEHDNLEIYSVIYDSIYYSNLQEVIANANPYLPSVSKATYFYPVSKITHVVDLQDNDSTVRYLMKKPDGGLVFYYTLDGFVDDIGDYISSGFEYFKISEISEDFVREIIVEEYSKFIFELLKYVPTEPMVAVFTDVKTRNKSRAITFSRMNFLNHIHWFADSKFTFEIYSKASSNFSSTISMSRFVQNMDKIKYATIFDKNKTQIHALYDYSNASESGLTSEILAMDNNDYFARDIVTSDLNVLNIELSLADYESIYVAVKKTSEKLNACLKELIEISSFAKEMSNTSISTDPLT